ncbi:agamous MADS-box protein [Salix suchowensis]|nr:agamous MADS-box protein [Salix suchowensis]
MARKSKGRQKLEMVKIPNESNLMVTFSKRRSGLFKKASELCTLCGAEVSIIVFSPGKKVFSFGHPSVEKVMERYVTGNLPQTSGAFLLIEAHRNARVHELNLQLTQREELDRMEKAGQSQNWWENPIQELGLAQLEQLKASLQYLKQDVTRHAKQILIQNSTPPQPFIAANPSSSGNLPFDTRNTGFFSNMAVPPFNTNMSGTPFNTNMAVPPFNTNMSGTPFNTNMAAGPFNASTVMPPFGYSLGYGNSFF